MVDEANDSAQLPPMAEQAEEMTGIRVPLNLADAGYFAGKHVAEFHCRDQQVVMPDLVRPTNHPYHKDISYDDENDSYICLHGQRLHPAKLKDNKKKVRVYRMASGSTCRDCPAFGVCTTNASIGRTLEIGVHVAELRRHRVWLATDQAKRAYQRRLALVEPLFAFLKNQLGAQRSTLRGMDNVKAKWAMLAVAFNLRTLWRVWRHQSFPN